MLTAFRSLELSRRVPGSEVLVGSVYAALERLEAKRFVMSEVGEATAERGGRAKRYFRITKKGLQQIHATRDALIKLWQGIPALQ